MKLNETRLAAITDTLAEFDSELRQTGSINCMAFELKLKTILGISDMSLKGIVKDLYKNHPFRLLVVYYMQNTISHGPPVEYKPLLAMAYGIDSYDQPECKEAREQFWAPWVK